MRTTFARPLTTLLLSVMILLQAFPATAGAQNLMPVPDSVVTGPALSLPDDASTLATPGDATSQARDATQREAVGQTRAQAVGAAAVSTTFVSPTIGTITQSFSSGHPGLDIQDAGSRPSATSTLCIAESGSVGTNEVALTYGDYDRNGRCDDWKAAEVKAPAAGQVIFAGVKDFGADGKPHTVCVFHGTQTDGKRVETCFLHLGTKVHDGRNVKAGEPRQSFIAVANNQCVTAGQRLGYQGYSGWSTATHLHYVVTVGGVPVDPATWLSKTVQINPPTACAGGGGTPAPVAPTGLSATALSSSSIRFIWNDVANETQYTVWRWNGSAWQQIGSVGANVTSYTDSGLSAATWYHYAVCALSNVGGACASYASALTQSASSGGGGVPSFCQHNRAQGFGRCLNLGAGRYDFTDYGFNDMLTTLLIPAGARWRVTVYPDVIPSTNECRGTGWQFTSNGSFWEINMYEGGLNFNDKASCAVVERLSSAAATNDTAVNAPGTTIPVQAPPLGEAPIHRPGR